MVDPYAVDLSRSSNLTSSMDNSSAARANLDYSRESSLLHVRGREHGMRGPGSLTASHPSWISGLSNSQQLSHSQQGGSGGTNQQLTSSSGDGAKQPPAHPHKHKMTAAHAAKVIQRWARAMRRKRKFREIIRRNMQRKKRFTEREKLQRRIVSKEQEVSKMRRLLETATFGGAAAVNELAKVVEERAATKIQAVWRGRCVRKQKVDLYVCLQ